MYQSCLKMFKFNFCVEEIESGNPFGSKDLITEEVKISRGDTSLIDWYDSEEIIPERGCLENLDVYKLNCIQIDLENVKISYMISGMLLEDIKDNDKIDMGIKKAERQQTDLIPGVYEGGAKIWECTDDLLTYLSQNYTGDKLKDLHVLDLGCGTGLLGIYAFSSGAKVTFQDYNRDVLEKITIPNVLLNTCKTAESEDENPYDLDMLKERNIRFFSGDWTKWSKLTKNDEHFDIILTSETIYNPDNQQKLLNCLYDKLKADGIVLLAAKSHYFGVGGGIRQFEQLIDADKRFAYRTIWLSTEGVNREIIELIKIT